MATSAQISFAFIAKDAASATIRGLSKSVSALGSVAGKVGGFIKSSFKVIGAAIAGAVAAAGAALYKFTKAAIEDEAAQAKLVAVLKARKMATTENLAATEAMIKAGARLAFTDDDIRGSLATATQFTHNFAKAQKIATAAQDLARAKNISLERATSLVGKAFAGNGRALKGYGIELQKTIKYTETKAGKDALGYATEQKIVKSRKETIKGQAALNAITKQFGGSAKAYATTTAGAIQAVQIAIGEAGETVGKAFLPIINEMLALFYDKGLPIIEAVANGIAKFVENNKELIKSVIETAVGFVTNLIPVLVSVGEFIFGTIIPAVVGFIQNLTAPGGVTDSIGKVVGGIMEHLVPAFGKFMDGVGKLVGKVMELVGVLWGDGTGPLAIAVSAVGGALSIILGIIGDIGGAIAGAIDFIMKLGKAIMDSPLGFIIKAIAGVMTAVPRALGEILLPKNNAVTPAAGSQTGSYGPQGLNFQNTTTLKVDGKVLAETVQTQLGKNYTAATGTRVGGR